MRDDDPYRIYSEMASPRVDRQSASVVQIESNKLLPMLMLCCVLSVLAISLALIALKQDDKVRDDYGQMRTRYLLMERRYMDMEAYAMLNGWKIPTDDSFGPTGNLERMTGDKHGRR